MKITVIHGQNHKGSSYHISKLLLDNIVAEKEITEFFLPRDLNHFCFGCYNCIDDESECPFHKEKSIIHQSIEQADLLIFTTPTYCLRSSAPMNSFMDLSFTYWMTHRPKEYMFHKKAIIISTSAGSSTKGAIKDIRNSLFYWGIPDIKSFGISVQAMNWDGVSTKKKMKIEKRIKYLAKNFSSSNSPKISIATKLLFYLMRGMQKSNWGSGAAEKQYWENKGWLADERPWKKQKESI